jgi:hypothetical protein
LCRVPRFFFHLYDDVDVPDDEGVELPDLAAARDHARSQALNLIGENVKEQARIVLHHRLDIEDEHGSVLEAVRFGDILRIEP